MRLIELSQECWVELMSALRPEERWNDGETGGLILYTGGHVDEDGYRKLVFKKKSEVKTLVGR